MKASSLLAVAQARVLGTAVPMAVGFELTHLCNLACNYCDRHDKLPKEMTFEEIVAALDGLKAIGMREISLDGGEPLAHRRVDDVVAWLVANGITTRMNTNGILIDRKATVVKKLAKVKISLDGPSSVHNSVRGDRAFERAIQGAVKARALGVLVEFTCVVGQHNVEAIDELLDIVCSLDFSIIFQPARQSLFLGETGPGSAYQLDVLGIRNAFSRIEARKRAGDPVLNGWASLRHFRTFPNDTAIPCAAGWINVTMDPEGNLYHCGQVSRVDKSHNVVARGVREAFESLQRVGCSQCWCARVVEENYAWGGRFDRSLPPSSKWPDIVIQAPNPPLLDPSLLVRSRTPLGKSEVE